MPSLRITLAESETSLATAGTSTQGRCFFIADIFTRGYVDGRVQVAERAAEAIVCVIDTNVC